MSNKRFEMTSDNSRIVITDNILKDFWFMALWEERIVIEDWVEVLEQLVDLLNDFEEENKKLNEENNILLDEIMRLVQNGAETSDKFNEYVRDEILGLELIGYCGKKEE